MIFVWRNIEMTPKGHTILVLISTIGKMMIPAVKMWDGIWKKLSLDNFVDIYFVKIVTFGITATSTDCSSKKQKIK